MRKCRGIYRCAWGRCFFTWNCQIQHWFQFPTLVQNRATFDITQKGSQCEHSSSKRFQRLAHGFAREVSKLLCSSKRSALVFSSRKASKNLAARIYASKSNNTAYGMLHHCVPRDFPYTSWGKRGKFGKTQRGGLQFNDFFQHLMVLLSRFQKNYSPLPLKIKWKPFFQHLNSFHIYWK